MASPSNGVFTHVVLSSGARLGPYEILALVGAGGMGEVYKATDTNLKRAVAIKVLPASVASDAERLARFQREAEVLAALNHPNIAAIYGLERSDGTTALVMELVEGPTLADRIAHGALPLQEALPIAKQIAEALEAAHEQGIIHRDLKPANIKLRPDGIVKVLDFGLAKVIEPMPAMPHGLSDAPTLTTPAMTEAGVILGTAAYMSPEQAKGHPAGKRSDIWAFGCMLFEMLSGTRAFLGRSMSETLGHVLHTEPNWQALPVQTPPQIRSLLRRCLAKDVHQREPHIGSARLEIEEVLEAPRSRQPVHRTSRARPRNVIATLSALSVLLVAAVTVLWYERATVLTLRSNHDGRRYQLSLPLPDGVNFASGTVPSWRMRLSPDGTRLAFAALGPDGLIRLYVRSLDAATAHAIPDTVGAAAPFWSPDGHFIGFFAGGRLMKVAATGGPAVPVCQAAGPAFGAHWSENNQILFSSGQPTVSPIRRVSAAGGTSSIVLTPNEGEGEVAYWWPSLLPDGDHMVYFALGPGARAIGIYVASLESQERKLLVPGGSNVTFANGFLIYLRDQTLVAHALDLHRLELVGEPRPIGEQVLVGGAAGATGAFTVSQTGVLAYQTGPLLTQSQLVWVDRKGTEVATVGEDADFGHLRLSPDGTRVSMNLRDPKRGAGDIWLLDLATGRRSRLTFDEGNEMHSVWSPDGQRLVFNSMRENVLNLYEKASNGAGAERLVLADREDKIPESWSPDGRHLLYRTQGNAPQDADLWMLPMDGSGTPTPLLQTKVAETAGRFSPDGRWIAYISNESGPPHLYIAPFPAGGGKWQVSSAELPASSIGTQGDPSWRADSKEVFYVSGNQLIAAEVTIQKDAIRVGDVRALFRANFRPARGNPYTASADGQRFLVNRFRDQTTGAPITLVVNWPAGLKR